MIHLLGSCCGQLESTLNSGPSITSADDRYVPTTARQLITPAATQIFPSAVMLSPHPLNCSRALDVPRHINGRRRARQSSQHEPNSTSRSSARHALVVVMCAKLDEQRHGFRERLNPLHRTI